MTYEPSFSSFSSSLHSQIDIDILKDRDQQHDDDNDDNPILIDPISNAKRRMYTCISILGILLVMGCGLLILLLLITRASPTHTPQQSYVTPTITNNATAPTIASHPTVPVISTNLTTPTIPTIPTIHTTTIIPENPIAATATAAAAPPTTPSTVPTADSSTNPPIPASSTHTAPDP